jgi:ferritin-like metal-binding protein YciE
VTKVGRAVFEAVLREVYDIEAQLLRALPKMVAQVADEQFSKTLQNHNRITQKHQDRLKKVFSQVGKQPRRKESAVMAQLIGEFLSGKSDSEGDLWRLLVAMRIEHLEVATYQHLMKLSLEEGLTRAVSQFDKNLGEEQKAIEDLEGLIASIAGSA